MTRRPRELECVAVNRDFTEFRLAKDDVGVVVHVYPQDAVEVEFMDVEGDTVALLTMLDEDLRILSDAEARSGQHAASLPEGVEVLMGDASARAKG